MHVFFKAEESEAGSFLSPKKSLSRLCGDLVIGCCYIWLGISAKVAFTWTCQAVATKNTQKGWFISNIAVLMTLPFKLAMNNLCKNDQ